MSLRKGGKTWGQLAEDVEVKTIDVEVMEQILAQNKASAKRSIERRSGGKKQGGGQTEAWEGLVQDFRDLKDDFAGLDDQFDSSHRDMRTHAAYTETETKRTTEAVEERNTLIEKQGNDMGGLMEQTNTLRATQETINSCANMDSKFTDRIWCLCIILFIGLLLTTILLVSVINRLGGVKVSGGAGGAANATAAANATVVSG